MLILSIFCGINNVFLLSLVSSFSIFLLLLFIISNPSNSCIWFLGFALRFNEVILKCSVFCDIKGSFSLGIISISYFFSFVVSFIEYSSLFSSIFFDKIIIDCNCWGLYFCFTLLDIIVNEFISCISKIASGSDILSWFIDSSVLIFWDHFSMPLIFWFPIICIPSIYCILWGNSFLICSINISFIGEGILTSFQPIFVDIICSSCESKSKSL